MSENTELLLALKEILHRKKSNEYYANTLNCSVEEIEWARSELKKQGVLGYKMAEEKKEEEQTEEWPAEEGKPSGFTENLTAGTAEVTYTLTDEIHDLEELIERCKIDTNKWVITRYTQNYWGNRSCPRWQVKAFLTAKSIAQPQLYFQEKFTDYISTFTSDYIPIVRQPSKQFNEAAIIIPKQDFHFDKYDTTGDNSIGRRFVRDTTVTEYFVEKASSFYNLRKAYYILGSDYFNAEYTKTTTKGTLQQNAVQSYHESFELACNHEVSVIREMLSRVDEVELIFIAGNHDYYVGWHLVKWIEAYFRQEKRLKVCSTPELRKYINFKDTAVMFNHGNDVKPGQLAYIFPKEYAKNWSNVNHYYIITGDKHQEKSGDYGAIRHYQVPALSSAKSLWDQNNGFVASRTEHSAFIIEEGKGFSNLFREVA